MGLLFYYWGERRLTANFLEFLRLLYIIIILRPQRGAGNQSVSEFFSIIRFSRGFRVPSQSANRLIASKVILSNVANKKYAKTE